MKDLNDFPLPIPETEKDREILFRVLSLAMPIYKARHYDKYMCKVVPDLDNRITDEEEQITLKYIEKLVQFDPGPHVAVPDLPALADTLHHQGYPHNSFSTTKIYERWLEALKPQKEREETIVPISISKLFDYPSLKTFFFIREDAYHGQVTFKRLTGTIDPGKWVYRITFPGPGGQPFHTEPKQGPFDLFTDAMDHFKATIEKREN